MWIKLCVVSSLVFACDAGATIFLNETFDDGTFNPPVAYECDYGVADVDCTNEATIVTSPNRAGTHSFSGIYVESGAAGFIIEPADYSTTFPTKSYLRFYINHDASFRSYNRTKVLRWHLADAPDLYLNCNGSLVSGLDEVSGTPYCDLGIYFGFDPANACNFTNEFFYSIKDAGLDSSYVVTSGSGWYYVEIMVDIPNKQLSWWVGRPGDVTPTVVVENMSLSGCANFDGNESLSTFETGWMNSVASGSGGRWYMDELIIADALVGMISGGDTTAPVLSAINPSGAYAQATTSVNLVVTTNEASTCRYSHGAATTWENMTEFGTTGSTSHSQSVATWPGLVRQSCYKCQDAELNESAASCTTYWVEPEPKQPVRH